MFLPKAVYAQIADICYERERRGEPAYEIHKGRDQIRHIPLGAICFIPDLQLKEGDSIPQFARIQHEPVLIATDDISTFVYINTDYNNIQMFNIENKMSSNYENNDYYVLVVHGLNFLFSDGLAPASPPRAKPSAPPTTGIRIDGGVATKAPLRSKTNLPFL